jgi:hypothetical protein
MASQGGLFYCSVYVFSYLTIRCRCALAELLAKEADVDKALRLTAKARSGPMHLTRARVLLAAKRPAEAVAEARKIVTPGEPDELSPTVEMYRDT